MAKKEREINLAGECYFGAEGGLGVGVAAAVDRCLTDSEARRRVPNGVAAGWVEGRGEEEIREPHSHIGVGGYIAERLRSAEGCKNSPFALVNQPTGKQGILPRGAWSLCGGAGVHAENQ